MLLSQVASVQLDVASVPGTKRDKASVEANTKLAELYSAISLGASSCVMESARDVDVTTRMSGARGARTGIDR